jgi:hypothetical protein
MNPVHHAEQDGGEGEDEGQDRHVPGRHLQVFFLEDERHQDEYQGAGGQADGEVGHGRVKGVAESQAGEQAENRIDHEIPPQTFFGKPGA